MSNRLYPHKKVRYWYVYDLDEICALFADLGLHKQTVRKWIKNKNGLNTIDKGRPTLVYGHDLIAYLKQANSKNKCQTAFDQMYCMGCQDARPILKNQISIEQKTQFLKVQAICRECKKCIFKNYKISVFQQLKRCFKLVDVSQLYDNAFPTAKTHLEAQEKSVSNESLQRDLFQ